MNEEIERTDNEPSQEYLKREFMHTLVNIFACIGATAEFIEVIKQIEEKPFTKESIEKANRYAIELYESLKDRFNRCYYYTVKVA